MKSLPDDIFRVMGSYASDDELKETFDLLKDIENFSYKKFELTTEKFCLFVKTCWKKGWKCNEIARKLAARTALIQNIQPEEDDSVFEYTFHFQ